MNTPRTSIRLIEPDDAETLAVHLGRDAEGFARELGAWMREAADQARRVT